MQFYFIRHGQSQNNALWDQTGSSLGRTPDAELTDTGRKQADYLGAFLAARPQQMEPIGRDPQNKAGFGLTHLYCSLMLRAIQTGMAVAATVGLPIHAWRDAHEEGGLYIEDNESGDLHGIPGSTRSFLTEKYPGLVLADEVSEQGWWNQSYEDEASRAARGQRFLRTLLERHGGSTDRVAVISHGGFFNVIMRDLLQIDRGQNIWMVMNNVGITRIDFEEDYRVIVYTNRTDFLPRDLIT